jgi:ribosomal protein L16 Arg81 hydroxylase
MIQYEFEDDSIHQLHPGDAIYIPRGVYHAPKIFGPRVTFSYNWHYRR